MLEFIIHPIRKFLFVRKWRRMNQHNNTTPGTVFPLELAKVGAYTYGTINLVHYFPSDRSCNLNIENFVSIANNVHFFLGENHSVNTVTTFPLKSVLNNCSYSEDAFSKGSIVIEDEVWIGYGVTILSGVTIGKGAIIATGAVVTSNIPAYTIAGGVPAKVIRERFSEDITKSLLQFRLADLPEEKIKKNIDLFYKKINTLEDLRSYQLLFKNK